MTESVKDDNSKSVEYRLHALSNNLYSDACFLKVIGKSVTVRCVLKLLLLFIAITQTSV